MAQLSAAVTPATPAGTLRGIAPVKYGKVLQTGSGWEAGHVESPVVWWDENENRWGMVYVGYNAGLTAGGVGLAWSDDLIEWEKDAANPILPGSGAGADSAGCSGPFVWYENGTYHLFYIGLTSAGYEAGTKTLCYATATVITGPWTRHGAIISPSGSGWRNTAIWHPNVVKVGSTYYLFFNATGSTGKEKIGYATSSSIAGPWTVDDTNSPILSTGSGTWDESTIGDPSVYRVGDQWFMAYYGYSGSTRASDGIATTTLDDFPLGWTKYADNPILTVGASGEFDAGVAGKPFIVQTPAAHYHFYTADTDPGGSANRAIALAIEQPINPTAERLAGAYTYFNVPIRAVDRTITATTYTTLTDSEAIIDLGQFASPQMRITGRAYVSGGTMDIRNQALGLSVAVTNGSWGTVTGTGWVDVPADILAASQPTYMYTEAKVAVAQTGHIGQLFYEVRGLLA